MKKILIGVGIAFVDIIITSDFTKKNHSYYSKIEHQIGGSILNIVVNCGKSGLIYLKGNDSFSSLVSNFLMDKKIDDYGIFIEQPMPIFTIINQQERYTSLTNHFEMNETVNFDYKVCNEYEYGITNSTSSIFINYITSNTKCKWIINSYLPGNVNYDKIEGVILNRDEAKKYHYDVELLLKELSCKKIKWAIITLDKDGCVYLENNEIKYLKPTSLNLKSKIRTGDLFASSLIKKLYDKETLSNAIKYAMQQVELFLKTTQ